LADISSPTKIIICGYKKNDLDPVILTVPDQTMKYLLDIFEKQEKLAIGAIVLLNIALIVCFIIMA